MHKLILILLILVNVSESQGARILGVFLTPMISTQIVYQSIWKELSLRGHEVTVLTPMPLKDPTLVNLTEIDLNNLLNIVPKNNLQGLFQKPVMSVINFFHELNIEFITNALMHNETQNLLKDKSKTFDVVLALNFFPTMFALSNIFDCPLIMMTPSGFMVNYDSLGNPSHPVLHPDAILPDVHSESFFQRLYNAFYALANKYNYYYHALPNYDRIAKEYIRKDLPYLGDMEKNASMMLVNVNPIIYSPRPNLPGVVEFGNIRIMKSELLPADLQKELDEATQGVIYFSMGSVIKSVALPKHLLQMIITALSELPYKILWKWEDENLPNRPRNVLIRKWFPQTQILNHPNMKVFITHGGLQSVKEAVASGVPIVGIPFFLDQFSNIKRMANKGAAQYVELRTLTKENFKAAIRGVAENPRFRSTMQKISKLSKDTPVTGLETVIWWIEYIIRHKGAPHLRSPAVNLPWYQYLLLDVIGFILGAIFVIYKIVCISLRFVNR